MTDRPYMVQNSTDHIWSSKPYMVYMVKNLSDHIWSAKPYMGQTIYGYPYMVVDLNHIRDPTIYGRDRI